MKRGYLGLFEGVYLAGRSQGYLDALEERGLVLPDSSIPLDQMIYLAAFQGGVQEFVTYTMNESDCHLNNFLSKKVIRPKKMNPEILIGLMPLFEYEKTENQKARLSMVASFIHDLIEGMQNNASIINVSGIPSVAEVKALFPPEISLPICGILDQLKVAEELLPAPALTSSRESVDRFREILESNVFSNYSRAHEELDFANSKEDIVLTNIKQKSIEVVKTGKDFLTRRRASLNVIPVLPKVVDAAFGKLPGILAQLAGDLAAKYLDSKRNIVIYQFNDWANEYANDQLAYHLRKQDEG